jgi:hypothetical protein
MTDSPKGALKGLESSAFNMAAFTVVASDFANDVWD